MAATSRGGRAIALAVLAAFSLAVTGCAAQEEPATPQPGASGRRRPSRRA
ncbi:hypothetical protein ACFQYP_26950 [Nonomuraea antimicrobica]